MPKFASAHGPLHVVHGKKTLTFLILTYNFDIIFELFVKYCLGRKIGSHSVKKFGKYAGFMQLNV